MSKFLLTLILSVMALTAGAETVSVVWGLSPGSNTANVLRQGTALANKTQTQRTYVFATRPGAGGSIAANSVANAQRSEVLAASSSFMIRPLLFKETEAHRVEQLRPIMMFAADQAPVLMSKKYRSWDELRQQRTLTIGVIPGSISHLMAIAMQRHLPNTELVLAFYPGGIEATRDAIGGHIDLTSEFLADSEVWIDGGQLFPIAITGTRSHRGIPTFAGLGMRGLENFVLNLWLLVPVATSEADISQYRRDLEVLATDPGIQQRQANAYLSTPVLSLAEVEKRFAQENRHWQQAAQGVRR
jgi:tripartite-type tricarboxylate transporter receptor subunit TctC